MEITRTTEKVEIDGYIGTWHTIDHLDVVYRGDRGTVALDGSELGYEPGDQVELFLMESEQFGDEAASLIVNSKGQVIVDDCYDDLETFLSSTLPEWEIG